MEINNFLKNELENAGRYGLTKEDKKIIKKSGIEEYIYKKLTSKKFRKFSLDEQTVNRTKKAIAIAVSKNTPLEISYFMGAYKLYKLPSSPYIDFAEFFNISYLLKYIAPIATAYKPGVKLTYYMHTLLMELHDNLSTEEISKYVDGFENLIVEFQKYLPKNIHIHTLKDADIYTREEYFEKVKSLYNEGKNRV